MLKLLLLILCILLTGCDLFKNIGTTATMDPTKNYERDMIVTVNGVTREGAITMPLLDVNTIHVYARGDLDTFIMKTCGGTFKKQKAWNITTTIKSGLFGWGSRKIDVKNETEFKINKTDFHETGVCPLYLLGISNTTGQNSEAYINWQTPEYQLHGYVVCNMEKRDFEGVEACSISTGSFTKLVFDTEVIVSPSEGCALPIVRGKIFEWPVHAGTCNYLFKVPGQEVKGVYTVYGWDEITIR